MDTLESNEDSTIETEQTEPTQGKPGGLVLKNGQTLSGGTTPSEQPAVTQTVGGMTLKKRAPGAASAPGSAPGTSSPAGFTPRPQFNRDTNAAPARTGPSPNQQKRMDRYSRVMPTRDPGVRMNDNIRAPEIRVIDDDGQVGVMSPREAMEIARQRGVDLIEIVPNAQPPVCKLIDFGKFKYEQQKRDKTAKKTTHQQLIKEVRFHPSTDTHDFDFKLRHARGFLEEGHKVKATVQFKGREVAYRQFGEELLKKFADALVDLAKVDQDVSMMGRMMTMMLSPLSKKKKEEPKEKKDRSEDGAKSEKPRAKKQASSPDGEATTELGEKLKLAAMRAEGVSPTSKIFENGHDDGTESDEADPADFFDGEVAEIEDHVVSDLDGQATQDVASDAAPADDSSARE